MPKVSVVVPVYKVEPFIEKCARSLFEQTLDDIEYVFVDDCSPDRSMEKLRLLMNDYPERFDQVKLVRTDTNSGQAMVRRLGISYCTGDYVIHCDSDDWVDPGMYLEMYHKAESEKLDLVICDMLFIEGENQYVSKQYYDKSHDLIRDLFLCIIKGSTCNKMIKRTLLHNEKFVYPEHDMCEDTVYSAQYGIYAKSIGYIPKAFYHYLRHSSSFLGKRDMESTCRKFDDYSANFNLILRLLEENGVIANYSEEIVHQKLFINNFLLPFIGDHDVYIKWREASSPLLKKVGTNHTITMKDKLIFFVAYLGIYPLLSKLRV